MEKSWNSHEIVLIKACMTPVIKSGAQVIQQMPGFRHSAHRLWAVCSSKIFCLDIFRHADIFAVCCLFLISLPEE